LFFNLNKIFKYTNLKKITDGLPFFGPAFLHFTSLESRQYFGRILLSVETELVPAEIENVERLQVDDIDSILEEVIKIYAFSY